MPAPEKKPSVSVVSVVASKPETVAIGFRLPVPVGEWLASRAEAHKCNQADLLRALLAHCMKDGNII